MTRRTCSISPDIFQAFPDYCRGVVVAHGITNGPSRPELTALLRQAEATVRERLYLDTLAQHPFLAPWRQAFKTLGIRPNEYRPSIEALVRRALHGQALPAINALVDLGNALSLKHLIPVGSHALDDVKGDLTLRPATGKETFLAFGATEQDPPSPGEIIFAEDEQVLTRRWIWRQATHTLTLPQTTALEFNLDGLPPVSPEAISRIAEETAETIQIHCGGRVRWELLTKDHPVMSLEP